MLRYYLTVIVAGTGLLALLLSLVGATPAGVAILAALTGTATVFLIDAIAALAVRWLIPSRRMDPFAPIWRVHRWERRFYVKLGIQHWKDRIPETGGLLVGFSKKTVADRRNNEYILVFLKETCYAELMHTLSIPLGFLVLLLSPLWGEVPFATFIGIPSACVNAMLQLLPVFVQRYVRPFLLSTYRRNERLDLAAKGGAAPADGAASV